MNSLDSTKEESVADHGHDERNKLKRLVEASNEVSRSNVRAEIETLHEEFSEGTQWGRKWDRSNSGLANYTDKGWTKNLGQ